jgi:esterase
MQLFYKEYPGPGKPLIILHGLFGLLDNWHNVAKTLSATFHVYTLDLRNHGQSPKSAVMNYAVMADDLWEFMQDKGISQACFMGHSMGGKVAMEFALRFPEKCAKLIVVDIAPKRYEPGHTEIFNALFDLDIANSEKTRKDFDQDMQTKIPEFGVRQFLLKSLERNDEGNYQWKFNLDALHTHYEKISEEIPGGRTYKGPTLFLRGGNSRYVSEEDRSKIESLFPNCQLKTIEGAGHWVHAEKPVELVEVVKGFLG